MMTITNVRLKKVKSDDEQLLGIASILLDNCLVIHNIRLIRLANGKRIVCFPSKKMKKFEMSEDAYVEKYEYTDIVHPANQEFREYIEEELYRIYDMEGFENE